MATTIDYSISKLHTPGSDELSGWQRIFLLAVLVLEAIGCISGGIILIAAPDGRYMDMPVEIMNGVFPDFLIPGIILLGLGVLNAIAFRSVLYRSKFAWIWAGFALGGLLIWFWVEVTVIQVIHWLHIMWGLPVIAGGLIILRQVPHRPATLHKALLISGIISSAFYVCMNIFIPMLWSGYNYASYSVRELSAIGAPTRAIWVSLGILYSLLAAAFGWGVRKSANGNRSLHLVGTLLIIYGVIGVFWPPMHIREVLEAGGATLSDTLHTAGGIITLLLMISAIGIGAMALGKSFRLYSLVTLVLLILFGALIIPEASNIQANLPTKLIGVWERINIGVFLLWVAVLAIILLRREKFENEEL